MCGPSNALKGFYDHVDRNRSIHQDRLVGSPHGGANAVSSSSPFASLFTLTSRPLVVMPACGGVSRQLVHEPGSCADSSQGFRSQTHPASSGGDLAFERFQAGSALPSANLPPAVVNAPSAPAAVAALNNGWISEFQYMDITGRRAGMAPQQQRPALTMAGNPAVGMGANLGTFLNQPAPLHPAGLQPHDIPLHFGPQATGQFFRQAPMPATALAGGNAFPSSASASQMANLASAAAQIGPTAHDLLDAAFQEYDDDFQDEMDQWMSSHGPGVAEQEDVQATMEAIANEQDVRRADSDPVSAHQPDDLARTAADLLISVGDNQDAKFLNSQFLNLMRRLASQEVILMGENLVEKDTGATVGTAKAASSSQSSSAQSTAATENAQREETTGKGKGVASDAADRPL